MRSILPVASLVILAISSPAASQERPRPGQGVPGTVTLPLTEYDRLVERASLPGDRPDPPPVPAVVSRAEIRARVEGSSVRGTMRLDGEVFKTGAVKVPFVSGPALFDARSDGRPLPIVLDGSTYNAVITGPAPFTATLDWGVVLGTLPGRATFVLPAVQAGSVSAAIDLPGDPLDLRVEPGVITRRQTTVGRTVIDVTLERARTTNIWWSVRETTPLVTPVERRMLSDVKSLFRIGEGDVRMAALVDITVIRGDTQTFELRLPAGFADASVSGSAVESTETRGGSVAVTVREPSARRFQFLVTAERAHDPGSFKLESPLLSVADTQRETGEVAIEGAGTLEVVAGGDAGLRRMDVREVHASLRGLSQEPLLAAFRFQRRPNETRTLSLDVKRFPDAAVLAAVAERATATTLVTTEGRMLTEIALRLRNHAQPFLKVTLPEGATMLSVEVGGEAARPVQGTDGMRIPLLRPGFRPEGPYAVSFVYLHSGTPFEKRGEARMALASIDLPVSMLEWELFVPERYSMKANGGNVIPAGMLPSARLSAAEPAEFDTAGMPFSPTAGQIVGRIVDGTGAALPGVSVTATVGRLRRSAVSDAKGWYIISGLPAGEVTVTSDLAGFARVQRSFAFDRRARLVNFEMSVAAIGETVTVTSDAPLVDSSSAAREIGIHPNARAVPPPPAAESADPAAQQQASQNVLNLQRRIAGVLPVRVDVPRTGSSHRFVRPLVLGEVTEVTFKYKRR
jgi:hypothetical protein